MSDQDRSREPDDATSGETDGRQYGAERTGDGPGEHESGHRISAVTGRRFLLALGGLFVVLALVLPLLSTGGQPLDFWVVLGVLVGGPGLVLLYGGYRLPRTDIHSELYPTVGLWCLRGVAVGLGVLALIALSSGTDLLFNGLLLAALGSLAGFGAGVYDARAKTRRRELRETIDRLRTSNERLEQFAYAASHDLQEPLRMVSSYLQLLDSRYRDDLDEDAREFIDFAVDGADRMRAMIDSLLDYSRVTTRGNPLEPTDAAAVLENAREDLRDRLEAANATVTVDELPTVRADERQLAQVFKHLLLNAIEYSGDEPPRVHVSAERTGAMWRVSVSDEGIGIDPRFHDQVFEVFEKVHTGDQGPEMGAGGIGLALCKRIVERHGGDIWVDSAPGEGATFSFTLPTNGGDSD